MTDWMSSFAGVSRIVTGLLCREGNSRQTSNRYLAVAMPTTERKLLRRVELPGAVAFVAQSQDQPFSQTPEHQHDYAYVWMLVSGDYSELIRGKGLRCYEPYRWSYHPQGERHVHVTGALPPVSVGFTLTDSSLVAQLPTWSCMAVGPRYLELGVRLYRTLMCLDSQPASIEALWSKLLSILKDECPERTDSPPAWIKSAGRIMHESYAEKMTLESVAERVSVHPIHLATTYKKYAGVSWGEGLRQIRLERACALLRETNLSIGEIATSCGFYDNAHLTRHFKRCVSMTPQQFRQFHFRAGSP